MRAVRIEVGAPARVALHVGLDRGCGLVGAVHLGGQAAELVQRQLGGAALGLGVGALGRRREGGDAFRGERRGQDVRRRVQVVLRVAADERLVLGEGHVAFEHARPHRRRGEVRFHGVLGEHHRRAAVADREGRDFRFLPAAGVELVLERPRRQPVDEVERPRPVGQRVPLGRREVIGGRGGRTLGRRGRGRGRLGQTRGRDQRRQRGRAEEGRDHRKSPRHCWDVRGTNGPA